MDFIIEAAMDDLETLAELFDQYRVSYHEPGDLRGSRSFILDRLNKKDSAIFISVNGDRIIGFVQLYPLFSSLRMKRVWLLNDLYIIPPFRRQGYSRALIKRCKEFCRETEAAGMLFRSAPTDFIMHHICPSSGFRLDDDNREYFWENVAF